MLKDLALKFAADSYGKKSVDELMKLIGDSRNSIRDLLVECNVQRDWTDFDYAMLVDMFGKKSLAYIADSLGRTPADVENSTNYLQIRGHLPRYTLAKKED